MEIIRLKHIEMRTGKGIVFLTVLLAILLSFGVAFDFETQAQVPDELGDSGLSKMFPYRLSETSFLLGSGLLDSQVAHVRYILWMEIDGMPIGLDEVVLALDSVDVGLVWQRDLLVNGWGERAVCFWAQEVVDIRLERLIPGKLEKVNRMLCQWYGDKYIESDRVSVFLEESVDEVVNYRAYWEKENISMTQICDVGGVISWSGFAQSGLEPRNCGGNPVNVQLTVRQLPEGGKTVLAFPALYNDI
ncbi:MAG: hypothetical protein FWG40_11785 [Peptococcaceae bacterium]|nr:hypothetical protein [Peptococcaceae bacterium]